MSRLSVSCCLCLKKNHFAVHASDIDNYAKFNGFIKHLKIKYNIKMWSMVSQPPKKMTAAQKTLAKADKTGMKSMASFFKVKQEKI